MQFNNKTALRCKEETGKIFDLNFIAKVFSNSRIEFFGGEYPGTEEKSDYILAVTERIDSNKGMDTGFEFHAEDGKLVPDSASSFLLRCIKDGWITWFRWYGNKDYIDCHMDGFVHMSFGEMRLSCLDSKRGMKFLLPISEMKFL